MKTVVLDTNELRRDWLCTGLAYQLMEHMLHTTWMNVYVPATVFEELVANFGREVDRVAAASEKVSKERERLGLNALATPSSSFDYRAYLNERFDERLGFTVLPWGLVSVTRT